MSGDWGDFTSYREYMDAVNEQLLVVPMIETVEALDVIEEILAVKGIDVLLIGPSDLSIWTLLLITQILNIKTP